MIGICGILFKFGCSGTIIIQIFRCANFLSHPNISIRCDSVSDSPSIICNNGHFWIFRLYIIINFSHIINLCLSRSSFNFIDKISRYIFSSIKIDKIINITINQIKISSRTMCICISYIFYSCRFISRYLFHIFISFNKILLMRISRRCGFI